jgi:phage shock protein PspC (stress-responsive transcriptional regulator)
MLKLKRITGRAWIGGVCAGVAYWLGLPTWILRMVWAMMALCYGLGIVSYIVLWIFMPRWENDPSDYGRIAE